MASIMVDIRFFRAPTVTDASRSGGGGLVARGFARELSEASYTFGGAEVLAGGALSLGVHARVALLTTITTVLPHIRCQSDFGGNLLRYGY